VKVMDGVSLEAGKSVVNLVSFHRGHKYVHTDIIEARFRETDDDGYGQWDITDVNPGGSYYGESQSYSIEQSIVSFRGGAQDLRQWVDSLSALANPIWLTSAWFCPIYRRVNSDDWSICQETKENWLKYLNDATKDGRSYHHRLPRFEFRPPQRKETGKPFPYGWDGNDLVAFLADFLSGGGQAQTISKKQLQILTGVEDSDIVAFIENGAVPIAEGKETLFDCEQLGKFLAHAYTKCWDGWKFTWGHRWRIERGKKPGALRIGGEDWYEVNYKARGPGVYLLFKDDKLKYVGESGCVMQRVATHYSNPHWGDFDMALYRPVPTDKRRAMERHYTRELCPQFDPHRYQVCN